MSCRADAYCGTRSSAAHSPAPEVLPLTEWQPGLPPAELSGLLFDGHCVVIRGLACVAELVSRAKAIVGDMLGDPDPERAVCELSPARFREAAFQARRRTANDAVLGRLWQQTLEQLGYAAGECYSDRLRLRVVPPVGVDPARALAALPPHRDNWASGIAQQVNWWMPLFELAPDRTMIVWPELFRRPVGNDSGTWDYAELRASSNGSYPLLPSARERPPAAGRAVLVEPGSLLAFSGAQLHASRNDAAGRARLSLDTRTVWIRDIRAGRGAPDVDGAARRAEWQWFGNVIDPGGAGLAAVAGGDMGEQG